MASLWSHPPRHTRPAAEWIIREFAMRGLSPPHCTPEALARALERERHLTIEFRGYVSDDPGVYGLLYKAGAEQTYMIWFRSTPSIILQRQILFHELAHILFEHALTEVDGLGALRGYMVSDADDAIAEAFAVGAMQYSFLEANDPLQRPPVEDEVSASAFGHFLQKAEYRHAW